ncbi:3-oxoacyl-acyl carrier protein reductase [Niveomyces insectorum RCEF 264]|uniref:3-oxoacyl-acyl carrier protein reductase n=1 Tax=Niveomyces insectorum RCEF 264 TaxID=1081102 RepID=A0A167Q9Z9_9HYPO|nr:3-oxoacyl-acyl carrier protein reductase [Niveomyces insectorum RCEF 264]
MRTVALCHTLRVYTDENRGPIHVGGRRGPVAAGRPAPPLPDAQARHHGRPASVRRRYRPPHVTPTLVGRHEAALQQAVAALPRPARLAETDDENGKKTPESDSGGGRPAVEHGYMAGDVRDTDLWEALFANTSDVHLLVNAAGVTQNSLLARTTPAGIRDVLDTNLYGTVAGCRSAMRAWLRKRSTDRCIINVSSLLAVRGGYGATVYAASKAGVVGLTRALAEEGGARRIRANVVVPGYIQTDMIANRIPLKRFGSPDEVADAVAFLAKNEYANNCVLNLDGGLSAAG